MVTIVIWINFKDAAHSVGYLSIKIHMKIKNNKNCGSMYTAVVQNPDNTLKISVTIEF